MPTIRVAELIGPICVDPEDGERLFPVLSDALSKGESLELDFAGVTTLTSSFLNPSLGKLYGTFSSDFIEQHLTFIGLDPVDMGTVLLVKENARRYYGPEGRSHSARR